MLGGVAVAIGVMVVGVGMSIHTTTDGNPDGWFVIGGFLTGAAVFGPLLYFVIWPIYVAGSRWRARRLGAEPSVLRFAVHSASFGLPDKLEDVTKAVNEKITPDHRLSFRASVAQLGADPAPGTVKRFWLRYWDASGEMHEIDVDEGDLVELP